MIIHRQFDINIRNLKHKSNSLSQFFTSYISILCNELSKKDRESGKDGRLLNFIIPLLTFNLHMSFEQHFTLGIWLNLADLNAPFSPRLLRKEVIFVNFIGYVGVGHAWAGPKNSTAWVAPIRKLGFRSLLLFRRPKKHRQQSRPLIFMKIIFAWDLPSSYFRPQRGILTFCGAKHIHSIS